VVDGVPLALDTEFEIGELIVQVSATTTRQAGTQWDAIGVGAGQSYWILPENEVIGQPFVGIGAEELVPGEWSGVTVTLTGASGSGITAGGHFSLSQDSVTPIFYMSTSDLGVDAYTFADLTVEDHAHFNWAFTEVGTYDLTFEISGTHAVDGFKTATATYTFSVIPEPSSALLGAFGALALLRRRRH
jgi:surface-anchored protein